MKELNVSCVSSPDKRMILYPIRGCLARRKRVAGMYTRIQNEEAACDALKVEKSVARPRAYFFPFIILNISSVARRIFATTSFFAGKQ